MASRKTANEEIVMEAELIDAAVEHIHKSSVGRADLAHWPNHGPHIDIDYLDHPIPGCILLREWSIKDEAKPGHVCMLRHAKLRQDEKSESRN